MSLFRFALMASVVMATVSCGNSRAPETGSVTLAIPPVVAKVCGSLPYAWQGEASGVVRDATLDRGEWIYSNGLWQALGANSDGLHRTDYYAPAPVDDPGFVKRDLYLAMTYDFFGAHRATHNGDYQLPQDTAQWPDGTADLAEVRLAADAQALHVRFLWNAMPRPDAQIATLTFATAGAAPALAAWPHNAALSGRWQQALTVWGAGAAVQDGSGHETAVPALTGDHVTEACVPLALLSTGPWTLQGGSGLADPAKAGQYWTVPAGLASSSAPGSGGPTAATNVWDTLFALDQPWTFDERSQADQLQAGVLTAAATVDPALLQQGQTQPAALRTGDLSRQFQSALFQADGIRRDRAGISPVGPPAGFTPPVATPDFNVSFFYTGRAQTYSMHVPAAYAQSSAEFPLIIYLHGFTGLPEEPFYNPVGLVPMADQQGYLLASALGRGDYFYRGEGDFDVMEVLADVEKHYRVDRDRIYVMGHSMGGYGTNNVGTHHPDLFAAIAPAEGTDSTALFLNLANLPWFMMTADEDLDTGAKNALAFYTSQSGEGQDATVLEYRTKIHEYSSIYDTLPRLFRFFGSHRRNANPAVVRYTRLPNEDRADLGLVYDGAYWLSGLRATDATQTTNITLESDGIVHVRPDPAAATRTDAAVDEGGPSGRTLAQLKQTIPATAPLITTANVLHLTTQNAGTARVDLARAQLSLGNGGLVVQSSADTALTLSLAATSATAATVSADGGAPATLMVAGGVVSVPVPAGSHRLVVQGSP